MMDDHSDFEVTQDPQGLEEDNSRTRPQPFIKEPEYQELLRRFQNGDMVGSAALIERLLEKYPGDISLLDFQREILVKKTFDDTSAEIDKAERKSNLIKYATRGGIVLAIVLVLGSVMFWAFNRYRTQLESALFAQQTEEQIRELNSKLNNADSYLKAGRPGAALELLREIEEVDPEFDGVGDLIKEAEKQVGIEEKYERANALHAEGKLQEALDLYEEIVADQSNYRSANQKIQEISDLLQIQILLAQIETSYEDGNWQAVIDSHDQIVDLDPSSDFEGLEEKLFNSYKNRIIEIAGQAEPTIEDIEKAQEYYRAALALFPQDKGYAKEREELQEIAVQLIGNKFYLFAISLLETGGYSPDNMREVLRLLERANSVGTGSPAITSEIDRVNLFVTGFEALIGDSYDTAIQSLERLYQLEPDYADGLVQYLLYEAYMDRGDALTAFAEFDDARSDYELAETFARGKYRNQMRIFWAEIQIGRMLRRLTLHEEAAEFFNFAFDLIDFDYRVRNANDVGLIEDYEDAKIALAVKDDWNASRLFEIVLEDIEVAYSFETVEVFDGQTIFEVAYEYGSTADAIRDYNELGVATTFRSDREIQVPYIDEFE